MQSDDQLAELEAHLLAHGWPGRGTRVEEQNLDPIIDQEVVKRFAPDERRIVLLPPPFSTVADDAGGNRDFWRDFGALDQLAPDQAVLIADFELGSDSAVVVDFRTVPARVLRLRWGTDGNRWVEVAASVDEFLLLLGLAP